MMLYTHVATYRSHISGPIYITSPGYAVCQTYIDEQLGENNVNDDK